MTLQEAKIADQILNYVISKVSRNRKVGFKIDDSNFSYLKQFKDFEKYFSLFIADGYLQIEDNSSINLLAGDESPEQKSRVQKVRGNACFSYKVTDKAVSFMNFKGRFSKRIEEELKQEKADKRKEIFQISKDIFLILLSTLSLCLSAF